MVKKPDTFLADELGRSRPRPPMRLTIGDGFRFGFGASLGVLLISTILSVTAWGIVTGFHLH